MAESRDIPDHLNEKDALAVTAPRPLAVVILAAGQGTRMKSGTHKVLHPIAGRPMLLHLLASVADLLPERQVVVVGAGREQVEKAVEGSGVAIAVQDQQLGTGHAVAQAHDALAGFAGDVLILYGDVPLVSGATMKAMLDRLSRGDEPRAVVLGFRPDDAAAYGRIIADADGRAMPSLRSLLTPYFGLLIDEGRGNASAAGDLFAASQLLQRPGLAQTQAVLARELSGGSDEASEMFRTATNLARAIEQQRVSLLELGSLPELTTQQTAAMAQRQERLSQLQTQQAEVLQKLAAYPRYRAVSE